MFWHKIYFSFRRALAGLVYVFRYELNFRIQTIFALFALIALIYFPLKTSERIVVILLIVMVLILELVNTVLERILDLFRPRINESSRFIKDIMAGTVLIAAVVSLVLGFMIFLPYVRAKLNF
jgi:diacylglycerol kinase